MRSVIFALITVSIVVSVSGRDSYNGPFDSWINVKTQFNAKGDGSTDDRVALQSALDLLNIQAFNSKTIYLPAGTYSVSNTLTINFAVDCLIIGEDPARTTIIYNGPRGGDLFRTNSLKGCRFERITWDGNNKANVVINHLWDGTSGFGCSNLNHRDEVIKNGNIGINAGNTAGAQVSEVGVVRVIFSNLKQIGVSLNNGNVLNWWIRDSTFTNNGRGIKASFGEFFVRNCIFSNNNLGDTVANQSNIFAIRESVSKGSGEFANFNYNANYWGHITLQRNRVESVPGSTVNVYLNAPFVMMDNTLKVTGVGWPSYGTVNNLIMIGERHQCVTNPGWRISVTNEYNKLLIDNDFTASLPSITLPSSPSNPPFVKTRPVFEPVNGTGEGIQAAINAAFAVNGQGPIVHLRYGTFGVTKTIIVPARFDVTIVGDGLVTKIAAASTFTGTVLSFEGPSYATLRSLRVNGGDSNVLIEVRNSDQAGSQIWMEGVLIKGPKQQGLLADQLANGKIVMKECAAATNNGNQGSAAIKVVGRGSQSATTSRVYILGGNYGNSRSTFEVANGGWLLARDGWGESNYPTYFRGSGDGVFYGQSFRWAVYRNSGATQPAIDLNSFSGTAVFSNIYISSPAPKAVNINSINCARNAIFLGMSADGDWWQANPQDPGVKRIGCNRNIGGQGPFPSNINFDSNSSADVAELKNLIAPMREAEPQFNNNVPIGATNLVFDQVQTLGGAIAIHVVTGNRPK